MAKEFDVDENGYTAQGFKVLQPKIKTAMRVGLLIELAIFMAVTVLIVLFAKEGLGGNYWPLILLLVALDIILVIYMIVVPMVFYARYRYKVGEERIDVLRGVFIVRHMVVPVERIHQVEVTRGPIKNMFGLADVRLTTAGGAAMIECLALSEAEGIADKLNERVIKILKERE